MKRTGLFYSKRAGDTAEIAQKIFDAFEEDIIHIASVEDAERQDFIRYHNIIAGVSTWSDGGLPDYWEDILPKIEDVDFAGKKVAIFALGDQKNYPDHFVDSLGTLADMFAGKGALLVGGTSPDGYTFNQSAGLKNGMFQGLVIDVVNQDLLTDERVRKWVEQLQHEMDEVEPRESGNRTLL